MKRFFTGMIPMFWILLLIDVVGTAAATFDFIRINQAQQTVLQNQAIQAQAEKNYINCLISINPKNDVRTQYKICYANPPQVKL